MPRIASGRRYAQAAFELAKERGELDEWKAGLEKLASVTKDEKLMVLMQNPKIGVSAKRELLGEKLGEVNPLILNLACLLVSRGMLKNAGSISQEYNRLVDVYHGIEHAEVVTALPLDDKESKEFSRRLEEMIGRKVVIETQVNPSLLGGFRAKIGDTLIDGSVRSRLESLRKALTRAGA